MAWHNRWKSAVFVGLIVLVTMAWPAQFAGAAGHNDEAAALENFLRQAAKEKAEPTVVFAARQKLAQLYADMGDGRKAEATWKDTVKLFAKLNLEKDGGLPASVTAEAAFRLLEPKAKSFMATPIQPLFGAPAPEKQLANLMKQLQQQLVVVRGSPDLDPEGIGQAPNTGLFHDYVATVDLYNALEWTYASALMRTRLLGHIAASAADLVIPDGLPGQKSEFVKNLVRLVVSHTESLALHEAEAAWTDAERRNQVGPWTAELKRELNRYRPDQYPLSRMRAVQWVEPAPAADVREQFEKSVKLEDVRACFDRWLVAHGDSMLGETVLQLTVDDKGFWTEVKAQGQGDSLEQCVRKKWKDLHDLPHGAAPVTYQLKLQFAAL